MAFLLLMGLTRLLAQEAVSTAGGNASGSSGSVSYTVGQVAYTTNSGSAGTVAQGAQHPYEVFVVTGAEETPEIDLVFDLYPNPSSGTIRLVVDGHAGRNLRYELYDMNGNLLQDNKLANKETEIEFRELPSSVYFLHVMDNLKELKIFKIIKN